MTRPVPAKQEAKSFKTTSWSLPLLALAMFLVWMQLCIALNIFAADERPNGTKQISFPATTSMFNEPYKPWKPRLIIHVGPPKTATSTIQELLTTDEWQERLSELDNYIYTGAFVVPNETARARQPLPINHALANDFGCHKLMSNARKTIGVNQTILAALMDIPCVQKAMSILRQYHQKNSSLIISDESLGFKAFPYHDIPILTSLDWISLKHLLEPEWNVTVIVGYRRYFDWMPSSKQQIERWTPRKKKMNIWTGGKVPGPLFPDYWKIVPGESSELPYFFTDTIVSAIQRYFPVHVLNLHDIENTVEADFLCTAGAIRSCAVAAKLPPRVSNPSSTVFYDSLVMAAFDKGIFHPLEGLTKRRSAVLEAQSFHLQNTDGSWPLICPSRTELEAFLELSLMAERRVWGSKSNMEEKHRQAFWIAVDKKKFCHVDTEACLREHHWKGFFQSIDAKLHIDNMSIRS